jgi:hypothetical protein
MGGKTFLREFRQLTRIVFEQDGTEGKFYRNKKFKPRTMRNTRKGNLNHRWTRINTDGRENAFTRISPINTNCFEQDGTEGKFYRKKKF